MSWLKKIRNRIRRPFGFLSPVTLPTWHPCEQPGLGAGVAITFRGHDFWVVSPDVPLRASPEAALCLLAPWCAERQRPLCIPKSLRDKAVVENIRSATALMGTWWGHPPVHFRSVVGRTDDRTPIASAPSGTGKVGLFFSGGVDSFYSLIHHSDISCIVYVVGFEVPVAKQDTWRAMVDSFRAVAAARGIKFVLVATNLRNHPRLRLPWDRHHGAALAVVGHLLAEHAATWVISSTWQRENLVPSGSHPDLDHLWGGTETRFVHFGAELWRAEKLARLADQPLVHRWLRVCYHDPQSTGNCGACRKCLNTRLAYAQELPGVICATMPSTPPLDAAVDALPGIGSVAVFRDWARFLERAKSDGPVEQAIRRLLSRSTSRSG
jgi:hypothetical protein